MSGGLTGECFLLCSRSVQKLESLQERERNGVQQQLETTVSRRPVVREGLSLASSRETWAWLVINKKRACAKRDYYYARQ